MLNVLKSHHIERSDLLVGYDTSPGAVLALIARLVAARDPYATLPPGGSALNLWNDPKAFIHAGSALEKLEALFASPSALLEAMKSPTGPAAGDDIQAQLMQAAQWFGMGQLYTGHVGPLFRAASSGRVIPGVGATPAGTSAGKQAGDDLNLLANSEVLIRGDWFWGPNAPGSSNTVERMPELSAAWVRVALRLAFQRLVASDWMTGSVPEVPIGVPKPVWAMAERAARLATVVRELAKQPYLLELRQRVRLLMQPALKPLLAILGVDEMSKIENVGAQVLAEPMHPWFAQAERVLLPSPRQTRWGAGSPTIGLIRAGAWSVITRSANVANDRIPTTRILETSLVRHTVADLIDWELMRLSEDEGRRSAAHAVLGFVGSGAPPRLHLHGDTLRVLGSNGLATTEPVSDVVDLLTCPVTAIANADGDGQLMSNIAVWRYASDPRMLQDLDRLTAIDLSNVPPVFLEPAMPHDSGDYVLGEVAGRMLQPLRDDQYWGEDNYVSAPWTLEGVAALLGVHDALPLVLYPNNQVSAEFDHLFYYEDNGIHPRGQGHIFHSERTRIPWRVRVNVPGQGDSATEAGARPTATVALSLRVPPVLAPIVATVSTDPERPMAASPLEGALVTFADNMVGE